jgi:hypothetical protein
MTRAAHPNAQPDQICVERDRIVWLLPRAAGVIRELQTMRGPKMSVPIVPGVGLMVILPPYDSRYFKE